MLQGQSLCPTCISIVTGLHFAGGRLGGEICDDGRRLCKIEGLSWPLVRNPDRSHAAEAVDPTTDDVLEAARLRPVPNDGQGRAG